MKTLKSLEDAAKLIQTGKALALAGTEDLLRRLPRGNWIGGTIPYFMTESGGKKSLAEVFVTEFPSFVTCGEIKFYDLNGLPDLPGDYPESGFSFIILPSGSPVHLRYARECTTWPGFFERPIVGWISGVDLDRLGQDRAKVMNGRTGEMSDDQSAVMHLSIPPDRFAKANILNIFKRGAGDSITFPEASFEVTDCWVNGQKKNFAQYLSQTQINTELPIVADYLGAMINVSFQSIDLNAGKVTFYAPVFPSIDYKVAAPLGDYEAEFNAELRKFNVDPVFACNCILNYLYGKLEGKSTGHILGPMTFGEIAYMLLNQTMVYLTIETKGPV